MIRYSVKKSCDLSHDEKMQLCKVFEEVFDQKRTLDQLEQQFKSSCKGYIYVALMFDEYDHVVGTMSVMPLEYKYFGKNLTFGRGIDAMILNEYRGNLLNLKKMSELLEQVLKDDKIPFIFSAPNEANYPIRKRISKWKDIYNLDIYVLPIHLGKVKQRLSAFNFISRLYAFIINAMSFKSCNNREDTHNIEKIDNAVFRKRRYNETYTTVKCTEDSFFVYKIQNFKGIETAFIVDVSSLNKENVEYAVKYIYNNENNIDLIVYFGYLDFRPLNLYKIPIKYKPKNTFVAGKILHPDYIDERIFSINNWKYNLSDLDWI